MATYHLDQDEAAADRVAVLMGGSLVALGSPQEIFEAPGSEEVARFVRRRSGW